MDEIKKSNWSLKENSNLRNIITSSSSEVLFWTLVQNSPDMITLTDLDDLLLYVNSRCERIVGYSDDKFTAQKMPYPIHPVDSAEFSRRWGLLKKKGISLSDYEYRILDEKGKIRWLSHSAYILKINYRYDYILSHIRNITEQKNAEITLKKSEEKFRNLFNNSEVGMFRTRLDGSEILDFNEKYLSILNYTIEEVRGEPSINMWADKEERNKMVKILEEKGIVKDYECGILNKQGDERRCITSLRLYKEDGILEGSIYDITERKQAEKALQESEEKFRLSFMTGLDAFYIATLEEGRIIDINQVFEDVFGYTREEVIGKTSLELGLYYDPTDREAMVAKLKSSGHVRDLEFKGKRKDDRLITISISVSVALIGNCKHIIGVIRDITERKNAENSLRLSEEHYRSLFDKSFNAIFLVDLKSGKYLNANKSAEELTGRSVENLKNLTFMDITSQGGEDRLKRIQTTKKPISLGEIQYIRPDGSNRDALISNTRISDELAYGIAMDITEIKQAEELLKISNEKFQRIFRSFQDAYFQADMSGILTLVSPSTVPMYGYQSEEEMVGIPAVNLYANISDREKVLKELTDKGIVSDYIGQGKRKDGSNFWVSMNIQFTYENGKIMGTVGVVRDISERKQSEEEIKKRVEELERFNKLAVGREMRVIELKQKVNELSIKLGLEPTYNLVFETDLKPKTNKQEDDYE